MKTLSKKWIELAKLFLQDRNTSLTCPKCGHCFMEVKVVPYDNNSREDIYIHCSNCKAYNVISCKQDKEK